MDNNNNNNMSNGVGVKSQVAVESQRVDCSVEEVDTAAYKLVESGWMSPSEYSEHIGKEKLHKELATWTGRELRFVHSEIKKKNDAAQIKSRLAEKAKQQLWFYTIRLAA